MSGTRKTYDKEFKTREKLMSSVFEFIEVYYNRQRLHSSLGYLSPIDFVKGNLKEKQELLNSKVA